MTIVINPGTGPVADSTVEEARKNIDQLIIDAGFDLFFLVVKGAGYFQPSIIYPLDEFFQLSSHKLSQKVILLIGL